MSFREQNYKQIDDPRCKQNSIKPIIRKICRNNCKYWKDKKCVLGYKIQGTRNGSIYYKD